MYNVRWGGVLMVPWSALLKIACVAIRRRFGVSQRTAPSSAGFRAAGRGNVVSGVPAWRSESTDVLVIVILD